MSREKAFRGSKHRLNTKDLGCLGIYFCDWIYGILNLHKLLSGQGWGYWSYTYMFWYVWPSIFFLGGGQGGPIQKLKQRGVFWDLDILNHCVVWSNYKFTKPKIHVQIPLLSIHQSKSIETWIIIGRLITARMWFWGFCRHISMEIPPKSCRSKKHTELLWSSQTQTCSWSKAKKNATWTLLKTRCWPQAQTPQNANEIIWALPTFNWSKFSSTIWSASEGIPPPKINGSPPQNGPPHFQEISSEPNHFQGYPQKSWTNSGVYLKQNWANVTEQFPIEKWHISAS